MIDFNAITQTKAFARQDGVFLSMLWIVTFALVIYAPQTDLGGLLVFSPLSYLEELSLSISGSSITAAFLV